MKAHGKVLLYNLDEIGGQRGKKIWELVHSTVFKGFTINP